MIGQTVGKYRVIERIGRGGMGTVYRATDDTLHRDVAIKILNAELREPEIAKRFRAEAITVARLNHPGIATVYEMFEHEGQWLMVMEFVRGETLEALIERIGSLTPEHAADICLHALAALAHAHSLGVVHRNLKPANLMIAESGLIKVMDFGIARVTGAEHLTTAGYMMGTPAYMAPEQVLGQDIDERADLYAIGVVFYRLVTGQLPFNGETPFAVAQSQVNDVPTPIGLLRVDLPPWVDQIVGRALAKNPQDRFQSAAAFHEALSQCLSDRDPSDVREPTGPMELMVTPPYAMPTGSMRPDRGTARTVRAPGGSTAKIPAPEEATAMAAPRAEPPRLTNGGILAFAAVLVVLTIIAGVIWRGRTPASSTAETTPTGTAPAGTTPAGAAGPTGSVPPAPAAVPPATAPVTPVPAPGSAAPGDARRSGAPANAAANAPASLASPGPPVSRPAVGDPVIFNSDVKRLVVTGKKGNNQDVIVTLLVDRVAVTAKNGGAPVQSVLYGRVQRATYIRAKVPLFDPVLPAPPADLEMPGMFASTHHWLMLQTKDAYLILRLEDANVSRFLDAIQKRLPGKIVKPG